MPEAKMNQPLSREDAEATVRAVEVAIAAGAIYPAQRGNPCRSAVKEAAQVLGLSPVACGRRLHRAYELYGLAPNGIVPRIDDMKAAARRGEFGTKPVLLGFEISKTTAVLDAQGEVTREYVSQRPERSAADPVPDGHVVKGVSTLMDSDGRTIAKWVKTREDNNPQLLLDALRAGLEPYRGKGRRAPAPQVVDGDLLTVYPIPDLHLGLYAWALETGADYDLNIAERLLLDATEQLVAMSPPSASAVVLNLGDFFHGDDSKNQTPRSGHALDIDTRYPKVLQTGVRLMRTVVERARERHGRVLVRNLPGNHDPHAAYALTAALGCFFERDSRVIVDHDPSLHWWHRWGRNLFFGSHGHALKAQDAPGYMAATRPKDWGETLFRHAFFGHLHHKILGGGEKAGVIWEVFQTLAAKDAHHAGQGYTSGRSMTAITYHRDRGEHVRFRVPAAGTIEA